MRTIAVVTTSRADYGHLYWVLRTLDERSDLEYRLVVTGAHLSPEFGLSVREIENDGIRIHHRLECLASSDTDTGMAKTIGVAVLGLADLFDRMRPDLLLLIADRYEMLAPASVALALRIPIAHIEGGDVSEGAIDDAVRNALTKLAHLHFTTTESSRRRVLAMGEEPWRVERTGAPSLDHLRPGGLPSRSEIERALELPKDVDQTLVSYHPVTIARDTLREVDAVYDALESVNRPIVFCFPNADAGSRQLVERARRFCERHDRARLFVNLAPKVYLGLLRDAAMMVGNSSSGIMEAPSFRVPTVDIGLRQHGRERARNIVDAEPTPEGIREAIQRADSEAFRRSLAGMENPYGDGRASERIVRRLSEIPLGEALLRKRPVPIDPRGGPQHGTV